MQVALFDFDSLIYMSSYRIVSIQQIKQWFYQGRSKEWMAQEIVELSINRLYNMSDNIQEAIEQTGIIISHVEYYITQCTRSKRKELYPDYKAKRRANKWVNRVRAYLLEHNFAVRHDHWEADDLIYDRAVELGEENCVIISVDKDLRYNIPGIHFNYYRKPSTVDEYGAVTHYDMMGLDFVSKEDTYYNFWLQLLVGDLGDNIKGVRGIGKVRAAKILSASKNHKLSVQEAYKKAFGLEWESEYKKNYFLLKLGTNRYYLSGDSLTQALNDSIRLTKLMIKD